MNKTREQQLETISEVKPLLMQWAIDQSIPLEHIEVVVPFVDDDFDLHAVMFMSTNADLEACRKDGMTTRIQEKYIASLKQHEYPDTWLEQVSFEFDSKENVDLNYEGSYFYRMR